MIDHDTVALIEDYYAAFNRGDWNAMLDCLADDIVHDILAVDRFDYYEGLEGATQCTSIRIKTAMQAVERLAFQ